MPYDEELGRKVTCLVCGKDQHPTAEEWLSEASLNVVSEVRPGQLALASSIERVISEGGYGVFEAGCGIGKSFAYAIPAIQSGKRVVISTGKKTLQEQLLKKDIPFLIKKLGQPIKVAPAYGKGNYACLKHAFTLFSSQEVRAIDNFINTSPTGRWSEATNTKLLPKGYQATNAEHCVNYTCNFWGKCKYIAARQRLKEAQVVVTNHWLVGYNLRTSNEGSSSTVLYPYDVLIVDEAHKLIDSIRDAHTNQVHKTALGGLPRELPKRLELQAAWNSLFNNSEHCTIAPAYGLQVIARLDQAISQITKDVAAGKTRPGPVLSAVEHLVAVKNSLTVNDPDNYVTYIENSTLCMAPVSVLDLIKRMYTLSNSIVYTSATLAIDNSLDIFKGSVGLRNSVKNQVLEGIYASPFNYAKQTLLYISGNVLEPTREVSTVNAYRQSLTDELEKLITASNGNAFVLFTARDELTDVYGRLRSRNLSMPLLSQSDTLPENLLRKYTQTPNAVLLGLKSFWEGVDIQGEKLSLVIITKLPFPQREDPVLNARRQAAGDGWFPFVDLPEMIMDLRQGIGRLIRSKTDRGVIAILDSKLKTKRYRNKVLNSLGIPNCTSSLEGTLRALRNLAKQRKNP